MWIASNLASLRGNAVVGGNDVCGAFGLFWFADIGRLDCAYFRTSLLQFRHTYLVVTMCCFIWIPGCDSECIESNTVLWNRKEWLWYLGRYITNNTRDSDISTS